MSTTSQLDMKLEVIVIPVSDVERAAQFYRKLGWRQDADIGQGDGRRLQFTPPGSQCSVLIGKGNPPALPGTTQYVHLVVPDIVAAREELVSKGVDASEFFHDAAGGYNRFDKSARASGPDPQRRSYASFLLFNDPDGNGWILQEITTRFPGRVDASTTSFSSAGDLAAAMRRASVGHGEHEKRTGAADPNWPDWYAAYMVAEQNGKPLPQ
jgi:catechol 2,3-dioxygenase-like lactoylglutathione lyase family enzyme